VDRYLSIVSLVKDALTGTQAGTGFVSNRKYIIQLLYLYVYVYVYAEREKKRAEKQRTRITVTNIFQMEFQSQRTRDKKRH